MIRKLLATVCVLSLMLTAAFAADGVEGTTLKPKQVDAKVKGCHIAEPGEYEVDVDSLIELDYSYPVVPGAIPNKVDYKQTLIGAIKKSPLGFRSVETPKVLGVGTIAFYFESKMVGEDTITLRIDGEEYKYKFKVIKK